MRALLPCTSPSWGSISLASHPLHGGGACTSTCSTSLSRVDHTRTSRTTLCTSIDIERPLFSTWYLLLGMPLFFDIAHSALRVLALDAWISSSFFYVYAPTTSTPRTSHASEHHDRHQWYQALSRSTTLRTSSTPFFIRRPPATPAPRPPCQATRHVVDIGTRHASPLPQFITLSSVHAAREGLSQLATGAGSQGLASVAQTTHHP